MSFVTYDPKNPFFKYDIDKLCALCHKKLGKDNIQTIHDTIPNAEMKTTVFQVLESVSQFRCEEGPQNLCVTCYTNTVSAYKFQQMCNHAQENITNYLQHQRALKLNEKECNRKSDTNEEETIDIKIEPLLDESTNEIETKVDYIDRKQRAANRAAKRVKCKVCSKMYRNDHMHVHMRVHTGERPYKCTTCHSSFTQWSSLKTHVESHKNTRNFICNYCGASFNNIYYLKAHEKTHTGERPYPCDQCELAFIKKSRLTRHYVVHTKEKAFQCEVCAKSFNRRSTLLTHQKIHNNDRKHVCGKCGKAFIQAHSLTTHLQMHVKKEMNMILANKSNTQTLILEVTDNSPESSTDKEERNLLME